MNIMELSFIFIVLVHFPCVYPANDLADFRAPTKIEIVRTKDDLELVTNFNSCDEKYVCTESVKFMTEAFQCISELCLRNFLCKVTVSGEYNNGIFTDEYIKKYTDSYTPWYRKRQCFKEKLSEKLKKISIDYVTAYVLDMCIKHKNFKHDRLMANIRQCVPQLIKESIEQKSTARDADPSNTSLALTDLSFLDNGPEMNNLEAESYCRTTYQCNELIMSNLLALIYTNVEENCFRQFFCKLVANAMYDGEALTLGGREVEPRFWFLSFKKYKCSSEKIKKKCDTIKIDYMLAYGLFLCTIKGNAFDVDVYIAEMVKNIPLLAGQFTKS